MLCSESRQQELRLPPRPQALFPPVPSNLFGLTYTVDVIRHVQDDVVLPRKVAPVFADHLERQDKGLGLGRECSSPAETRDRAKEL